MDPTKDEMSPTVVMVETAINGSKCSDLDVVAIHAPGEVIDEKAGDMFLQNDCEDDNGAVFTNEESMFNSSDRLNVTVAQNPNFKVGEPVSKVVGDGSDSGVDVNNCCGGESSPALQRAFSNNSAGYASSCGGLEYSTTPAVSCDSSLISCYSTYEDTEDMVTSTTMLMLQGGDGTSEGGSESSSVTGKDGSWNGSKRGPSARRKVSTARQSVDDKQKSVSPVLTPSPRPRTSTPRQQTPPISTRTPPPSLAFGRCSTTVSRREKAATSGTPSTVGTKPITSGKSSGSTGKPSTRSVNSVNVSRSHSKTSDGSVHGVVKKDTGTLIVKDRRSTGKGVSRSKVTSGGLGDDGRWPSSSNRSQTTTHRSRGGSLVEAQSRKPPLLMANSVNGCILETKASALEKYATLPRRRRHKSPESVPMEAHQRSHSVSRDPSLNRAASLRKQLRDRESNKSLPPYPRRSAPARTKIYHETSVQTALTGSDVQNALAGVGCASHDASGAVDVCDQEVQVDEYRKDVERLTEELRQLSDNHSHLQEDCERHRQKLGDAETRLETERAEKLALKDELEHTTHRVLAMLGSTKGETANDTSTDSLQELETQIQTSGHVVVQQQHEINELQTLCRTLHMDLEKSLLQQTSLLQQQQETEAESMELQDFLQAEKITLADTLRDAETEMSEHKQQLQQMELDLQRQQEECKHLVRISEQRRQENLALVARLSGLEQRSKELLLQQGAAVSGAAVALSGLGSRLDGLIDRLVAAYDISEKDLEDVIFHNEAYSKSNSTSTSSVEASPERATVASVSAQSGSPKRGASFVAAVISAIKNAATQSPFGTGSRNTQGTLNSTPSLQEVSQVSSPDSVELLDAEKDPCVAAEDPCVAAEADEDASGDVHLTNSESLQNLSQAILIRQQSELAQGDGSSSGDECGEESVLRGLSPAITIVDQVIEVDNLVTKLLKVIRILQLESETCIDELHDERVQLAEQVRREQESRREVQEELRSWERLGPRLRSEVQEARLQLQQRVQDLEEAKAELERHREQVEHLSQDVCNLGSLQHEAEMQLRGREEEARKVLQQWQETGQLPSAETLARIITGHSEIPALKKQLSEKEHQLAELGQKSSLSKQLLTDNWHQAVREARRQYDAIDNALETLQSIQGIVEKCPPLAKLQQELEETNFHCITSLPVVGADLNANAALVTANGTHNSGSNGIDTKLNSVNHLNGSA